MLLGLVGAIALAACTEDLATPTSATTLGATPKAASSAGATERPRPFATPFHQAFATAAPTSATGAPYLSPVVLAPSPATPDPTLTPPPLLPGTILKELPLTLLGRLTPGSSVQSVGTARISSAASLSSFLARMVGTATAKLPAIDFGTQEVLAIYDAGTAAAGCVDPSLGQLFEHPANLAFQLTTAASYACNFDLDPSFNTDPSATPTPQPSHPPRPISYTFYAFGRASKTLAGAVVWNQ